VSSSANSTAKANIWGESCPHL